MLDVGRLLGLRSYKPQVALIAILPAPNGNQELRREEAAGRRTLGAPRRTLPLEMREASSYTAATAYRVGNGDGRCICGVSIRLRFADIISSLTS